ncbi:MAG: tetratricopeptide repeat protein, partial [Candidatus Riflebacteria bacterium]
MNNSRIRFIFCFLIALTLIFSQTGCNKKRSASRVPSVDLPENIRGITIEQLMPKSDKVTGKFKNEVSEAVKDEYMYGTLAGQYGKIDTARKHLMNALKKEPKFVDAHHNLGLAYYKQGQVEKAISSWKTALELAPSYAETYYNLA